MKLQQYIFIFKTLAYGLLASALIQCKTDDMTVEVYETSESGNALKHINEFVTS
jgi:hypothetical protein